MSTTALRRGRDGELVESHEETGAEHDCGTQNLTGAAFGYLGEDAATGNPRYCFVCRPHLRPKARARRGFSVVDFG